MTSTQIKAAARALQKDTGASFTESLAKVYEGKYPALSRLNTSIQKNEHAALLERVGSSMDFVLQQGASTYSFSNSDWSTRPADAPEDWIFTVDILPLTDMARRTDHWYEDEDGVERVRHSDPIKDMSALYERYIGPVLTLSEVRTVGFAIYPSFVKSVDTSYFEAALRKAFAFSNEPAVGVMAFDASPDAPDYIAFWTEVTGYDSFGELLEKVRDCLPPDPAKA